MVIYVHPWLKTLNLVYMATISDKTGIHMFLVAETPVES